MKENNREEDIKILENYIYNKKETMKEQLVKAIEHLIKAYKELEEYYEEQNEVNAKFIPVSLVEETIEEYQNNMKLYENETHNIFNENNIRQEVITVLQKLLEKR